MFKTTMWNYHAFSPVRADRPPIIGIQEDVMFDFEGHSSGTLKELLSGVTLVISWVSVQVIFALYYAHKFYDRSVEHGNHGFTFPNNPLPDYWNFIRFAFVIGMRIQAPRVQVTSKEMRRVVLAHSVLSFILSVAILVLALSIIIRLFGR